MREENEVNSVTLSNKRRGAQLALKCRASRAARIRRRRLFEGGTYFAFGRDKENIHFLNLTLYFLSVRKFYRNLKG